MVPHLLKCFLIPNRLWRTNWFLQTPGSLPVAILNAVPDPLETQETGQIIRRNTTLLRCHLKVVVSTVNPYCQILENSSRNFSKILIFRVMTQTVYLENSSNFFSKFQFWGRELDRLPGELIHSKSWVPIQFFFQKPGREPDRITGKLIHSNCLTETIDNM